MFVFCVLSCSQVVRLTHHIVAEVLVSGGDLAFCGAEKFLSSFYQKNDDRIAESDHGQKVRAKK